MSKATTEPERLVREWMDVSTERKYQEIPTYVSESYVLREPGIPEEGVAGPAGEAHGPEGIEEYLRLVDTAFPDIDATYRNTVADENVVMMERQVSFTWEGEWLGIPPTGNEVAYPIVEISEVADGKVQAQRSYFDTRDMLEQMGVL